MNLFETVKANVSVPEAARAYGLTVTRHSMARCPFHNDRHPSLKLNPDFYYCFGCGAKGDVIDLVAELFNLSPYEAARKIAEDFGIDPDKPPEAAALAKPRHPMIRAFRDDERYCQRVLCDYLHLLEDWKVQYAPASMDEEPDDRFVEACQMLSYKRSVPIPGAGCTHVRTNAKITKSFSLQSLKEEQTQWQYRSTRSCAL